MTEENTDSKRGKQRPISGELPPSIDEAQAGFVPMDGGTSFSNLISKLLRKPLSIFHTLKSKEGFYRYNAKGLPIKNGISSEANQKYKDVTDRMILVMLK